MRKRILFLLFVIGTLMIVSCARQHCPTYSHKNAVETHQGESRN